MWKELLKVLLPDQAVRSKFIIPEEDDFDPDTYGKPLEQIVEGETLKILAVAHTYIGL